MSGHGADVPTDAADSFTRIVALSVAVYAVGLAIATFGGSNVAKEMLITKQEEAKVATLGRQDEATLETVSRQEEFNVWTQYQAKATREAMYRNERTKLEAEKQGNPVAFPPFKEQLSTYYADEAKRMEQEKKELAARAKQIHDDGTAAVRAKRAESEERVGGLLAEFATLERKDPYFDFAEVALQLAIVLASVAMLGKKWWAFLVSVGLAAVGLLLTANGFALLAAVPGIESAGHEPDRTDSRR